MHALKHPFWVLHWQLVGAVRPHSGLVGAWRKSLRTVNSVCVYAEAFNFQHLQYVPIFILFTWTSGPRNHQCSSSTARLCVCVCVFLCGRWTHCVPGLAKGAVPRPELQSGAGLQPHSTAAWQAALALGWPLPPPGRPHLLTSLAWQERPNKLRASWSSQYFHGKPFFFNYTPFYFSHCWCMCCTQTNSYM